MERMAKVSNPLGHCARRSAAFAVGNTAGDCRFQRGSSRQGLSAQEGCAPPSSRLAAQKRIRAIDEFHVAHRDKVCQPRKDAHRHHPVLLPRSAFERLTNSTAQNLKEFLESYETAYCELNDPGLELDIDRPEDYQRARKLAIEQSGD